MTVYSARREADFVMSSSIRSDLPGYSCRCKRTSASSSESTALPRTPAAVIPSLRLGNQPIKNFPLVVTQISRSMTHMFR